MAQVSGPIKCELIFGDSRYIRHTEPWWFYSDVLGDYCDAPTDFINDTESVPLIRGTNREAGVGHDLVCRRDFRTRTKGIAPTKYQAAQVFFELQDYFDSLEMKEDPSNVLDKIKKESNRAWDWCRRLFKTGVVVVAPGYWHKFNVLDTYELITGKTEELKGERQ